MSEDGDIILPCRILWSNRQLTDVYVRFQKLTAVIVAVFAYLFLQ